MASEKPIDNEPMPSTPKTNQNANDKYSGPSPDFLSAPTPNVEIPPSRPHYHHSCKKQRDGWDYAKLVAEFVGLLFLILYTLYTAGIYCANRNAAEAAQNTFGEIQKQTTLTRQQIVGTQAAVINIADYPGITLPDIVDIAIRNDGHVIAHDIHVAIRAKREILPSEKPIGDAWGCNFPTVSVLAPTSPYSHQCRMTGFSDKDWRSIGDLKETIILEGTITYENGFGDIIDQAICKLYVSKVRTKYGEEGEAKFLPCDQVEEVWSYLRKRKAEK